LPIGPFLRGEAVFSSCIYPARNTAEEDPMILRVVVFYVLTWVFTILIGGLQQEAGLLPGLTFLPQWGPGIAGLITMLIFRKRDGVGITFFSECRLMDTVLLRFSARLRDLTAAPTCVMIPNIIRKYNE
jgi:hypothetical protein